MKKLALTMIIVAIIMIPVIASADEWADFQGTYKMVASGSCIHSQNGYYDPTSNGWIRDSRFPVIDSVWESEIFAGCQNFTFMADMHCS